MMRTSNPTFNESTFDRLERSGESMTLQGTTNKTAILLTLLLITASWTWNSFLAGVNVTPWLMGGALGGLVLAIATVFKKTWAPVTGPLYACAEGFVLGGLSAMFEEMYPGIAVQAIFLTFSVFAGVLLLYKARIIQATNKFRMGLLAATGGICILYLLSFVLGFFGIQIPVIHSSSNLGIAFSLFVVAIAALNLVLDFDLIEQGCKRHAPKYMEWYSAFALMVTLVWLYIEILRLLSKINSRR